MTPERWDVVVVGAGPAGAMAGLLLARQGRRVLIVDKAAFPREKVCGCCLGARGARLLRAHGLEQVLSESAELKAVEIRQGGRHLRIAIPTGYAIPRSVMDDRLVQGAIAAGAVFRPQTSARLGPASDGWRRVDLSDGGHQRTVEAKLVLACDGIRGTLLDGEEGCRWRIATDSWMGLAASVSGSAFDSPRGVIAMHVGQAGYVGSVRLSDGTLHFAAAIDPAACKSLGGPIPAVQHILAESGVGGCLELERQTSKGTPLLTRERESYGSARVLALGDACAYIEPFTGEGMTWALESAAVLAAALPLSLDTWNADTPERWMAVQKGALAGEQRLCRALRFALHRPRLMRFALRAMGAVPAVAQRLAGTLNRPGPVLARSGL